MATGKLEAIRNEAAKFKKTVEKYFKSLEKDGWYIGTQEMFSFLETPALMTKRNFYVDEELYDILDRYNIRYETYQTANKIHIFYVRNGKILYQHSLSKSDTTVEDIEFIRTLLLIMVGNVEGAVEGKSAHFLNQLYLTLGRLCTILHRA